MCPPVQQPGMYVIIIYLLDQRNIYKIKTKKGGNLVSSVYYFPSISLEGLTLTSSICNSRKICVKSTIRKFGTLLLFSLPVCTHSSVHAVVKTLDGIKSQEHASRAGFKTL